MEEGASRSTTTQTEEEPTHTSREQKRVERRVIRFLRRWLLGVDDDANREEEEGEQAGEEEGRSGATYVPRRTVFHRLPFEDYGPVLEDADDEDGAEGGEDAGEDPFENDWEEGAEPGLCRAQHIAYATRGLSGLPSGYASLDASRPWLCYWILNSLELLGALPSPAALSAASSSSSSSSTSQSPKKKPVGKAAEPRRAMTALMSRVVDFLKRCQAPTGGFGGGPGQLPHLAPTYAAVNALIIIGTEEAYRAIDRPGLHAFLLSRKRPDGSFTMHEDGEVDIRGTYCALSAAALTNVLSDQLIAGSAEYLASCQTYEGGMGGEPGNEAHGGYAYCGVSAMTILGQLHRLDLPALLRWTCERQMRYEGGFQGRTNKLVDSCYSFWQSAIFPQIQPYLRTTIRPPSEADADALSSDEEEDVEEIPRSARAEEYEGDWLFDQIAVQGYLFACCQDLEGGLRDKPPKYRDYYHTCYALAGLSVTQHNEDPARPTCLGGHTSTDVLKRIDATHAISVEKVKRAKHFFRSLPPVHS